MWTSAVIKNAEFSILRYSLFYCAAEFFGLPGTDKHSFSRYQFKDYNRVNFFGRLRYIRFFSRERVIDFNFALFHYMKGDLLEGEIKRYQANVYSVISYLSYVLSTVHYKREKYPKDNPEHEEVNIRNVMDSGRFFKDKAMNFDIPEQECRIKDRDQEKIVAQVLYFPKNYMAIRLSHKIPSLKLV